MSLKKIQVVTKHCKFAMICILWCHSKKLKRSILIQSEPIVICYFICFTWTVCGHKWSQSGGRLDGNIVSCYVRFSWNSWTWHRMNEDDILVWLDIFNLAGIKTIIFFSTQPTHDSDKLYVILRYVTYKKYANFETILFCFYFICWLYEKEKLT